MVNAVGFAIWPTPRTLGWPFIVAGRRRARLGGVRSTRARSAALLFAAIALQGAALVVTGRSSGATAPYLSLKMAYLAIYPLAVAAAVMLADAWRATLRPATRGALRMARRRDRLARGRAVARIGAARRRR